AEDVRPAAEGAEIQPAAYVPLRQAPDLLDWHSGMHVVARSDGQATLPASLRGAVLALDPNMPTHNLRPLADDVSTAVAAPRFAATVLSVFAAIALVMAAVGVYGVLAHIAAQRTREIGVRVALGATRAQIIGLMMRDGAMVVGVGLAAGLLIAMWCAQALTSLLHAVTPADPAAMGMVSVVLCAAGVLAAYIPARRAARVNVVAALKADF
nr:FtsX-like permease family protein [Acidobacteriota bacterium]